MLRVLHVDDEPSYLELVKFFLEREGDFEVMDCTSAEEAIDKLKANEFDAMVVDYSLPGMNGIDLLRVLRAQGNDIPFILLTGRGKEETASDALSSGADLYLQKGANPQLQFSTLMHVLRQSVSRRKSEDESRRTARLLADVFNSIQDGMVVMDKDMTILRLNPTMEKWYPTSSPVVGRKCHEAFVGRKTPCEGCPCRSTLDTGVAANGIVPRIGSEGEVVGWLDVYSFPMLDSRSEELTGVIEFARDITGKRKAEDGVKELAGRLQAIVGAFPDLHFVVQPDGKILEYSSARDDDLYLPPKEFLGKRMQEVLPPDVAVVFDEMFHEAVREGSVKAREYSLIVQGEKRFYEARAVPMSNDRLLVVVRNITERMKAEDVVKASEEKYRQLVEMAQEGIWLIDSKSRTLYVNPRMTEMLGYAKEEMMGRAPWDFVAPDKVDSIRQTVARRMEGSTGVGEVEYVRKDGSTMSATVRSATITGPQGPSGAIAVVTDISERKTNEQAIKLVNEKLSLLGHITRHDTLNQLSVLMGWLDIVRETITEPPSSNHLANMKRAALAIQKELEFSADYESVGVENPVWVDVDRAYRQGISDLDAGGVSFSIDVKGIDVFADQMLAKVFHNLADNSLRHGQKVTRINIRYRESKDGLTLIYEDDGVGVGATDKEAIFRRGEGRHTGYGLHLIKGILGITGIEIRETGKPGEGARFEMLVGPGNYRVATKAR